MLYDDGLMEERDYRTYVNLFRNISNFLKHNTLIVHLDVSPEKSLERIKQRARDCEAGISLEYLKSLHDHYEEFLLEIAKVVPVIRVNWSNFKDPKEVAEKIIQEYQNMNNIHTIHF